MSARDELARSNLPDFLGGGGTMGALMRATDWAATPLGAPDAWPQALGSAVQICLNTPGIAAVIWGPDLRILYNDTYAPALAERHPDALGQPFREVWPEIWDVVGPQIASVLATGQRFSTDHQRLTMNRHGQAEDTYWLYSFAPLHDGGRVAGIFLTALDRTDKVKAERRLAEQRERQRRLFEQAPGFIAILSAPDMRFEFVNDAFDRLFGRRGFVGRTVREAFPELADQGFYELLDNVHATGERFIAEATPIRLQATPEAPATDRYLNFVYEPVRGEDETITGIFIEGHDATEVHVAREMLRRREARLALFDQLGHETAQLVDADAVLAVTTRLLGEHLALAVCAYADMDDDGDGFTIRGDWAAPGAASIIGHYSLADFGALAVERLNAGLPLIVNDNRRELPPDAAATFQNIGIAATICMPLIKAGRLAALMAIHDRRPRVWSEEELALLGEVTARSWAHVERVATLAELRSSEERLRLAVENAEVGFWDVDVINDVLIWPPRTKAMFGIAADAPVTMQDFFNGLHPDDTAATGEAYAAAADPARRALYDVEYRTIGRDDGVVRWVAAKGRGIFDQAGRCLRVAGTAVDITARKGAEAALREREEQLRDLNATLEARIAEALAEHRILADVIDGADIFVQVVDRDFNWLAINNSAAAEFSRIFSVRCPGAGDNMLDLLRHRPDDRAAVEAIWSRALNGEEFVETEAFGDASVERRYYEMRFRVLRNSDGEPVGAYQFVSDVTERLHEQNRLQEAEEALLQSQKMEALGQLTGGVAHDFNNLLTPIMGTLDRLQRKGIGDQREQLLISGAAQSAERARVLVQRLLAFARRQPLQPVAVDLAALVTNMSELIASTTGPQVRVLVDTEPALPSAMADPNQLEMALLNLAVNARDAMPEGGTLRIAVAAGSVSGTHPSGLPSGDYVRLSVSDDGLGMDEDTLARAVEPFFSTKGIGQGTGLGLSMVHGLAMQLGGAVTILSRPGEGTRVELWLPRGGEVQPVAPSGADADSDDARPTRRGTVLLVDDETLVRLTTADMLGDLGYEVVEAESAEAALSIVDGGLVPDVLVTDHLMPGMSGTELATLLKGRHAPMRVLVVSGYAEAEGIAPDLPRLTKPFRIAELAESLDAIG